MQHGLGRLDRRVRARHGGGVRNIVAAAVRRPNCVEAARFPGNLITARGLLDSDRIPAADLADRDRAALEFQRGAGAAAVAEMILIADHRQVGRAE